MADPIPNAKPTPSNPLPSSTVIESFKRKISENPEAATASVNSACAAFSQFLSTYGYGAPAYFINTTAQGYDKAPLQTLKEAVAKDGITAPYKGALRVLSRRLLGPIFAVPAGGYIRRQLEEGNYGQETQSLASASAISFVDSALTSRMETKEKRFQQSSMRSQNEAPVNINLKGNRAAAFGLILARNSTFWSCGEIGSYVANRRGENASKTQNIVTSLALCAAAGVVATPIETTLSRMLKMEGDKNSSVSLKSAFNDVAAGGWRSFFTGVTVRMGFMGVGLACFAAVKPLKTSGHSFVDSCTKDVKKDGFAALESEKRKEKEKSSDRGK